MNACICKMLIPHSDIKLLFRINLHVQEPLSNTRSTITENPLIILYNREHFTDWVNGTYLDESCNYFTTLRERVLTYASIKVRAAIKRSGVSVWECAKALELGSGRAYLATDQYL